MAKIEIELDMEDLPYELADQYAHNHRALLDFILDIDERVCERSFTEELIKQLTKTLKED